ncbi:hypothetical protein [Kushneria indalinina]|uniref:Uncharacterized protein n=1 Tax=Kushneria indalinina DSM 14324 TaxID=1122140 RepID=A0A3D9DSJ3_9GAMM|nr:hypothetical protein [Kushneria indalinina]REC93379.1 hypothetical protein C8D72_3424 [Kushneria indalinina DSM 14324]
MNRNTQNAMIRIDLTLKAQRIGLCPNRRDVMVMMEQPLINEVAMLYETAGISHPVLDDLHWTERLDAFMEQAYQELEKAPNGSRSFDFDIAAPHRTGALLLPLHVGVHVEIEHHFGKQALVFSLSGRDRLAA